MNLTYLATVKSYLSITTTTSDAQLTRMISALSNMALSYMQRGNNLARATYTETQSGVGNQQMMLRNWPAISVSSIKISNASYGFGGSMFGNSGLPSPPQNIPAAQQFGSNGFMLEVWDGALPGKPQNVVLSGYNYPRGNYNIQFVYQAGYCIQNEPATIPASPGPYTVAPAVPNGPFSQDDTPTYASTGVAFQLVKSSPAQGQYAVSQNASTGVATYTFAAADQGVAIFLNYSFIPSDLENAVVDMIGERFKYMARIGEKSHSLGGQETVSYDTSPLTGFDMLSLNTYKKSFAL